MAGARRPRRISSTCSRASSPSTAQRGSASAFPAWRDGSTCRLGAEPPLSRRSRPRRGLPRASPIGLGNDAQLALLAEATAGAAIGLSDAILLAIGTGIGSAVLAGGRIVARQPLAAPARSAGLRPTSTTRATTAAAGWNGTPPVARSTQCATSIGLADGAALVDAARARRGVPCAALATAACARLGTALAGAVALLDPAAVILAGGVAASLDVLGTDDPRSPAPAAAAASARHRAPGRTFRRRARVWWGPRSPARPVRQWRSQHG